ncbi:MAG: hypothetical protein RLZZ385_2695 [Pseudomonadota bacterium]|jgi:N-methylhydantoinase A
MDRFILGVDAGGTFTDFVLWHGSAAGKGLRLHKVLSTPEAPEQAILQGIRELGLENPDGRGRLHIIHGSTVATNAVLQGQGARTALVTNRGFRDLLTLGRQTRPALFSLEFPPREPPVPPELCLETGGRCSAAGATLEPLTEEDLADLVARLRDLQPAAVAINLLFSFVDDRHERRIEAAIQASGLPMFVSRSSAVLPQYREYERGIATWLNASLGPVVNGYLSNLSAGLPDCSLRIMQSSGETLAAAAAAEQAVHLLLSGPAGGLAAMAHVAAQRGEPRVISFDMGGTSTDVALLEGAPQITSEGWLAGYPVGIPMVDMHTIGAGGGSIAHMDAGGMLQVGPQSAGALPGPAGYGRGGKAPTVTDANLVLGRLPAELPLAGGLRLDVELARLAVARLASSLGLGVEETAAGIIRIANEHMAAALRLISVQRGHDPREFILACFGGAGGLHVCALAHAMGMTRALVPANAGVLSAVGMLVAPRGRQVSRTVQQHLSADRGPIIQQQLEELAQDALADLEREELLAGSPQPAASDRRSEWTVTPSVDLRYRGQSYWLNVPWRDVNQAMTEFQSLHESRYGFALPDEVELVNLRIRITAPPALGRLPPQPVMNGGNKLGHTRVYGLAVQVPVLPRGSLAAMQRIQGPVIIVEASATTFVEPGWEVESDSHGNLILTSTGG